MKSNTTVCSTPHSNSSTGSFLFFSLLFWFSSLRSGRNFSLNFAALVMNFARWFILPRKDLKGLSDFGGFRFCIASVLLNLGLTPDTERWCRNQSTWFLKNSHFKIFDARFYSTNFFSTVSTNFPCSVSLRFDTMRMSSKKQKVFFAWLIVLSIAFWNSAGKSAKQKNPGKESMSPGSLPTDDVEVTLLSCVCSQF